MEYKKQTKDNKLIKSDNRLVATREQGVVEERQNSKGGQLCGARWTLHFWCEHHVCAGVDYNVVHLKLVIN